MNLKQAILDYALYNHWANENLIQWLNTIDKTIVYKQTQSSFESIDLTLQHMKLAQIFWCTVITKGNVDQLDETIKINSIDWVMEELLAGSKLLVEMTSNFTEDELIANVSSPAITKKRYEFILHAVNHNSYHRGQIVTISRSFSITSGIPNTDYDTYLWKKTN